MAIGGGATVPRGEDSVLSSTHLFTLFLLRLSFSLPLVARISQAFFYEGVRLVINCEQDMLEVTAGPEISRDLLLSQ